MLSEPPRPCPVCQGTQAQVFFSAASERLTSAEAPPSKTWTYYRCPTCESTYLAPLPSAGELETYYESGAYHCASVAGEKRGLRHFLAALPFRIQAAIARPLPRRPAGKHLDFGCGPGDYLSYSRDRGWDAMGVEFNESSAAAARARGFAVMTAPEIPTLPDSSFDLITLIHSFEHIPDPAATLSELAKKLKPGGNFFIEVPYLECAEFRLYGRYYYMIQAPVHLAFFTDRTMEHLAGRLNLSLAAKKNNLVIPPFFWGSLLNLIDQRWGVPISRRLKMAFCLAAWPIVGWVPAVQSLCGQPVNQRQYTFVKH